MYYVMLRYLVARPIVSHVLLHADIVVGAVNSDACITSCLDIGSAVNEESCITSCVDSLWLCQ